MPRIWQDSIDEHRDAVQAALLDATGALVARSGLARLNMAQIAAEAGVGRATLYRYFPDLDAILNAWHERHVAAHLASLASAQEGVSDARQRLKVMLEAYAQFARQSGQHGGPIASGLHRRPHMAGSEKQLRGIVRSALVKTVETGDVRDDVPVDELVDYVLAALGGAAGLSGAGTGRLVDVTLAGLAPQRTAGRRPS